ncbi:MAG: cation transporter, partial [Clostridium sp.]
LNPMFGAAAMSLSSFCVVSNALRLNLFRMHDASKDRPLKKKKHPAAAEAAVDAIEKHETNESSKEEKVVKKTMSIEGMMCGHCEARVKKCLEALPGVEAAEVSHEKGTAVVTASDSVTEETLKKAVEDQDYKVLSIQ